jgi:hypothetical protein
MIQIFYETKKFNLKTSMGKLRFKERRLYKTESARHLDLN